MTANAIRVTGLTTVELYRLDKACMVIRSAFGHPPYLVGSAGIGGAGEHRDVDVRLILDDSEFAEACPTKERWAAVPDDQRLPDSGIRAASRLSDTADDRGKREA